MQMLWSNEGALHILEVDPFADPDAGPGQSFKTEILKLVKAGGGPPWILFDMALADFPDSKAVAELLWCNRLVKQHGGALMLLSPSGTVWENLQAEGATNLIPYRWDRNEAVSEYLEAIKDGDVVERLMLGNKLTYRPSLLMKVHRFSAAARMDDMPADDRHIFHSDDSITLPEPEQMAPPPRVEAKREPAPQPPPAPKPATPAPAPRAVAAPAAPPAIAASHAASAPARVAPAAPAAKPTPPMSAAPALTAESRKADWNLTLEVYHTAAALARKHGVAFSQQSSFEDFMAAMSDRLN